MKRSWLPNIPPKLMGVIQLSIFVVLVYIGSFGGVLMGLFPPAFIIGGNGISNILTRSR